MSEPEQPSRHWSVRLLPLTSALLILAVGYAVYIWYSRREATRSMQQRIEQQQQRSNWKLPPEYLSDHAKVLSFTIAPAGIPRGGTAELCYALLNAKSLEFDPPLADATPDRNRCLTIRPTQTTTYKLTVHAADGSSDTQSLTVIVR